MSKPYRRPSRVRVGPSTTKTRIVCLLAFLAAAATAWLGMAPFVGSGIAAVCFWGLIRRTSLVVDLDGGVLLVPVGFLGWRLGRVPLAQLTGIEVLSRGASGAIAFVGTPRPGDLIPEKIVAAESRYTLALAQATRVATLLGLPLDDGMRRREAQLADESLRERVLRTGADTTVVEHDLPFRSARSVAVPPTQPPKARTRVVVDGEALCINAPGPRVWVASMWLLTFAMVASTASAVIAESVALGIVLIVCAFPALCVFGLLFVLSRGWRLTIDRQTAAVRHLAKANRNIPLVELLDLLVVDLKDPRFRSHDFIVGGSALAASTKDGSLICFGHGCPKAELEWIAASVRHHLLVTA